MFTRLTAVLLFAGLVAGCTGSFHLQRPIRGADPTAITVDARQRVLLSQLDPERRANHPAFRRFCAEPSPDVFTVLGVAASGSLNFGLGADGGSSRALQGAFSSSETGATIARTQTINMLREMMFRTCERYLSGAISANEFPIIAARDQRIMVSILAIEQLTGSITPRSLAITSGGNALTGSGSGEALQQLNQARAAVVAAQQVVVTRTNEQNTVDTPDGVCVRVQTPLAAGAPAPPAADTTKLGECNTADRNLARAVEDRDKAQQHYDNLVSASRGILGTSSATASGSADFGSPAERSQAVTQVAVAVQNIVAATFSQDETQLLCIRVLDPASTVSRNRRLRDQCIAYLLQRVENDQRRLAAQYGVPLDTVQRATGRGAAQAERIQNLFAGLRQCAMDSARSAQFEAAVNNATVLDGREQAFLTAMRGSESDALNYVIDLGEVDEGLVATALSTVCGGLW